MLLSLLEQNPYLLELIQATEALGLSNCFVAGASIAQTHWNIAYGFSSSANIKDIDLIYFDPNDLSEETEQRHQQRIQKRFAHIPIAIDVRNEARVHLWYEQKFGYAIKAYGSSEEAIDTFPITAGCVGIRKEAGDYKIYAPFGFDDLFNLVVRPNKQQITKDIYEAKRLRWRPLWPNLSYVEW
jgi:uncharacterized protein